MPRQKVFLLGCGKTGKKPAKTGNILGLFFFRHKPDFDRLPRSLHGKTVLLAKLFFPPQFFSMEKLFYSTNQQKSANPEKYVCYFHSYDIIIIIINLFASNKTITQ